MTRRSLPTLLLALAAPIAFARCPIVFTGNEAATVGIYIEELATGRVVADYNSGVAMTPASILKSVTCATALNILGPDFTFTTDIMLVGEEPSRGHADLIVVGAADPTTGSREFRSTVSLPDSIKMALLDHSITDIAGQIMINGDVLPEGGDIVPQWEVEDISEYYGVGLFPVNWMDNYFETDYIIPSPPDYFKEILTQELVMNGVRVEGEPNGYITESAHADTLMVYSHRSPSLQEIMKSLMARSDNLMAEATLRALAPGHTRDSALSVVRDYWKGQGIDLKLTRLLDGNGLARGNAISASQMGRVLSHMAKSELSRDYISLFPLAGKDGTVRNFMRGTKYEGRLAVKSGSMTGVHCYAGYRLDASGNPTHTVVVMVNNFFCQRAQLRKAIENYLVKVLP